MLTTTSNRLASLGMLVPSTALQRLLCAAAVLGVLAAVTPTLAGAPRARGQTPTGEAPSLTPFGSQAASPATVNYPAGWNLISGRAVQGLAAEGATVPLYTYSADGGYERTTVDAQAPPMAGYWAYFAGPRSVMLPPGPMYVATVPLPAQQFVLVGNPGTWPANTGAMSVPYVLYVYDPVRGSYQQRRALLPGEGAWSYSAGGAILGLVSAFPCQALRPPAALPDDYVPSAVAPSPTVVPSAPAAISCYEPG
jgi:hypothetical protein